MDLSTVGVPVVVWQTGGAQCRSTWGTAECPYAVQVLDSCDGVADSAAAVPWTGWPSDTRPSTGYEWDNVADVSQWSPVLSNCRTIGNTTVRVYQPVLGWASFEVTAVFGGVLLAVALGLLVRRAVHIVRGGLRAHGRA